MKTRLLIMIGIIVIGFIGFVHAQELIPEPEPDKPISENCGPGTTLQDGICVVCDVNDSQTIRKILDDDYVVQEFLKYYPSSTFKHYKIGDEPGNPRTYSEFHYGIFALRTFVSTYGPSGDCYHVYGYSIEYDVPNSLIREDLPKSIFSQSNDVEKAVQAIKSLTSPLQQYQMGIKYHGIQCKDSLELVGKMPYAYPNCVKPESVEKLTIRGWATSDKTLDLVNPTKPVTSKDGMNFELLYSLNGAKIQSITQYPESNSIHVLLDDSEGGQMIISIPRGLMDAKLGNNQDDEFFVILNGMEYMYGEKVTDDSRILTIWFPKGTHDIEIIGTFRI